MSCASAHLRAHNRTRMKRALSAFGLAFTLLLPATAWAESEWDGGSPPPLDFALQTTAAPSTTAPYPWLRSTDSPELEQTWNASGVNTAQLTGVDGGVATGMTTALGTDTSRQR